MEKPAGVKERLDYNQDFKLDWHDPDEAHDGYQLKWVGKTIAKLEAGTAPDTVIIPDEAHNSAPAFCGGGGVELLENKGFFSAKRNGESANIFLTGDNSQALKHLQNCYRGAVKMIYIDPPYNTGSDGFVYQDKFEFTDPQLKAMLGLSDDEVRRLHIINGRSSHSAWLSFMYPRLKLAKSLLREDGVIFISIDDNEQANLKLLCDEVFGEANFIGISVRKTKTSSNKGTFFAPSHDYVLCYAKEYTGLSAFIDVEKLSSAEYAQRFKQEDSCGKYQTIGLYQAALDSRPNQRYFIKCPDGSFVIPPGENFPEEKKDGGSVIPDSNKDKVWRWSRERYLQSDKALFVFKKTATSPLLNELGERSSWNVYVKNYLHDRQDSGILPRTLILDKDNAAGSKNVSDLGIPFSFAKPVSLVSFLGQICGTKDKDIILDFFAGSGTTAQAVMELNAQDGGKRQWILCQLDEPTAENDEARRAGYQTIDQIARERIKRAAEKIGDKNGFRHYKIQQPEAQTIDKITEFNPENPQGALIADDMVSEFACAPLGASGEAVLLATWAAADGYKFTDTIKKLEIEGYTAHYAGGSRLYLIAQGWRAEQTKALLNLIGKHQLNVNALVIYGYSFTFESSRELENTLSQTLDKTVQLIKRY